MVSSLKCDGCTQQLMTTKLGKFYVFTCKQLIEISTSEKLIFFGRCCQLTVACEEGLLPAVQHHHQSPPQASVTSSPGQPPGVPWLFLQQSVAWSLECAVVAALAKPKLLVIVVSMSVLSSDSGSSTKKIQITTFQSRNTTLADLREPKKETMRQRRYCQVLGDWCIPFMSRARCHTMLQDSAPCHVSRMTKDFLRDNGVRTIAWPGNSQ